MTAKPLLIEITPEVYQRAIASLRLKLARAIVNCPEDGDHGIIAKITSDLRAMDMIEPVKAAKAPEPPKPLSPEEARKKAEEDERKEAAADPVKMQAYNRKVAKREAAAAANEERAGS